MAVITDCPCGKATLTSEFDWLRLWFRVQHGGNPEHSRIFLYEDLREMSGEEKIAITREWLDAIHAREMVAP